jgi:hypothetical protein
MTTCANPRCSTEVDRPGAACSPCLRALPDGIASAARSVDPALRRRAILQALRWWSAEPVEPVEPVEPARRVWMRDAPRFPRMAPTPGRSMLMRETPRFPRLAPPA